MRLTTLFLVFLIIIYPVNALSLFEKQQETIQCLQEVPIKLNKVTYEDSLLILIENKDTKVTINSFLIQIDDNPSLTTAQGLKALEARTFKIPYNNLPNKIKVTPRTLQNKKYCVHIYSQVTYTLKNEDIKTNIINIDEQPTIKEQLQKRIVQYKEIQTYEKLFVYDNKGTILEINDDNKNYLTKDYLGSTRAITNEQGKIIYNQDYEPYGKQLRTNVIDESHTYTGKEYDEETNLYYYGARYYDPELGRFTQVDPIGSIKSPYEAFNSNPNKYIDPDGNSAAFANSYISANKNLLDFTLGVASKIPLLAAQKGELKLYDETSGKVVDLPPQKKSEAYKKGEELGDILNLAGGIANIAKGISGLLSTIVPNPSLVTSVGITVPSAGSVESAVEGMGKVGVGVAVVALEKKGSESKDHIRSKDAVRKENKEAVYYVKEHFKQKYGRYPTEEEFKEYKRHLHETGQIPETVDEMRSKKEPNRGFDRGPTKY